LAERAGVVGFGLGGFGGFGVFGLAQALVQRGFGRIGVVQCVLAQCRSGEPLL
jgi:hypothetical protein